MAGTISPPGSAFTAAPSPVNTSIEMPTVRNFNPLKSSGLVTGFLNQPSGWVGIGPVREGHHVGVDRLVELVEELLAPAVLVPGQEHVGVHAERRARAPQRQRLLLAVMVGEDAVAAVERALGHGVEQAERRHHRARRQHLDLDVAPGHVVDLLGEVVRVLVEDVLGRPGALPAHGDGTLRLDHVGEAERRCAGRRRRGAFQKPPAGRFRDCLLIAHVAPPR